MTERIIKINTAFTPATAALLVQKASQYKSHISLAADEKTANAKSIMGIISLNLHGGSTVRLQADGEDEQKAITEIENFLNVELV